MQQLQNTPSKDINGTIYSILKVVKSYEISYLSLSANIKCLSTSYFWLGLNLSACLADFVSLSSIPFVGDKH